MTEKYAQAGVTDIARGENGVQAHTSRSASQVSLLYGYIIGVYPLTAFTNTTADQNGRISCTHMHFRAQETVTEFSRMQ